LQEIRPPDPGFGPRYLAMIAGQRAGTRQTNDQPAQTPDSPPSHEESPKRATVRLGLEAKT
jgi:hypothetical protein